MKTLDELIKTMDHVEFCCTNCKLQFDCDEVECFLEDALHYLKEYKDDRNDLTALRAYWAEQQANNPLDWSELKQMEGKPVWVEYDNHLSGRKRIKYKVWDVIDWVTEDLILVKGDYSYKKDEFGDVWKAYRKERHENAR